MENFTLEKKKSGLSGTWLVRNSNRVYLAIIFKINFNEDIVRDGALPRAVQSEEIQSQRSLLHQEGFQPHHGQPAGPGNNTNLQQTWY